MSSSAAPAGAAVGTLRLLLLRILFGTRNGALFGLKVRAPHALVLTALYGSGGVGERARAILSATATHATTLAAFATLYKSLVAAQALLEATVRRRHVVGMSGVGAAGGSRRALLAGALAGGVVFREPSSINKQIVLFLFSRSGARRRA